MKVTLYRYEKETLVMRSVEMEKLQAALRTENLNKPVSTTRDKAMFALPGTQNSYIQKLPVVVFGGTFRKTGEPAPPMRDYSGLVLLEVNHLSDLQEAVQIRQQAAMMPQTLLAFVGFSGKSVKIVIPFTLPEPGWQHRSAAHSLSPTSGFPPSIGAVTPSSSLHVPQATS